MAIVIWLVIWVVLSLPVGLVAGSVLAGAARELRDEPPRAVQGW